MTTTRLNQQMAGAIGLVLALSTTALGAPRRQVATSVAVHAVYQQQLIASVQAAVVELEMAQAEPERIAVLQIALAQMINLRAAFDTMNDLQALDGLDLQAYMQRRALTQQIVSNILKALHDAAMNTVTNIKG